jgi:hypothetical protein
VAEFVSPTTAVVEASVPVDLVGTNLINTITPRIDSSNSGTSNVVVFIAIELATSLDNVGDNKRILTTDKEAADPCASHKPDQKSKNKQKHFPY